MYISLATTDMVVVFLASKAIFLLVAALITLSPLSRRVNRLLDASALNPRALWSGQ